MVTLTKAVLIAELEEQVGLDSYQAIAIVDGLFEALSRALENHEELKLSGFGNFKPRYKKSRPARNPKTGVAMPVNARWVVSFAAGVKLKKMLAKLKVEKPYA